MLKKLGIEADERALVGWAALSLALIGWADASIQNAAETIFLKRVGVSYLPWAFLIGSALLVVTTYIAGRAIVGRNRPKLLPAVMAGLAIVLMALWALSQAKLPGIFAALLVLSKQFKSVALVVFWVALGDLVHSRQAKRLLAPLLGGLTLGSVLGSFASQPIGQLLGVDGLIYFSAGVFGIASLAALPLRSFQGPSLEQSLGGGISTHKQGSVEDGSQTPAAIWQGSVLFRLLAVMTLCSGLLGPMLYFQFSYVADLATEGANGEQKLLALYAQLRGWIHLATFIAQLALTARLFRRFGVPLAAVLSPLLYVLGFLGLSVRLSLPTGVAAVAATKLQDNAVYEPALRVFFSLFPESVRARAAGLLEGPVERTGGALGNIIVLGALAFASAAAVSFVALPIAVLWLLAAGLLWRRYPELLLQTASHRSLGEDRELVELMDPATLRAISQQLQDPDPGRCAAAIQLINEIPAHLSLAPLAAAAGIADRSTRSLLIMALNERLEGCHPGERNNEEAALALDLLLRDRTDFDVVDRARLVQTYGWLTDADTRKPGILEEALKDAAPAVRLAAGAALHDHGPPPASLPDLDAELRRAADSPDDAIRSVARRELCNLLLNEPQDERWPARLGSLACYLDHPSEQREASQAIAGIARRFGQRAQAVAEDMLSLHPASDPSIQASILRFIGFAGLSEHASALVEHVGSPEEELAEAASEGLIALGPSAADALLMEHSFGRRSAQQAILSILREMRVEQNALHELYEREIATIQNVVLQRAALSGDGVSPILLQRLEERVDEGLFTALLFLTAIRGEDRIRTLGQLLRRAAGRREQAILLEALESLLSQQEKAQLLPLFEDQSLEEKARIAARALGRSIPTAEEAGGSILNDSDELTRNLARQLSSSKAELESRHGIDDDGAVLSQVEKALQIKAVPIFERLSTRQLMDLAELVREESYPAGTTIFQTGDEGNCMYVVLEGTVHVKQGDELLTEIGARGFFGEVALFEGVARSASVITHTDISLLRCERSDLLELIEENPAIAIGICQSLSRRLRDLTSEAPAEEAG